MNEFYEISCRTCEGSGETEYGPICYQPASMCCGGCFEIVSCNVCQGSGIITIEDEYEVRAFKLLTKLMYAQSRLELQDKLTDIIYYNAEKIND